MFTNLMYMDTAKSPKCPENCNGSFSNNVSPPKKVYGFNNIKDQRTSTPLKNINFTQDDKTFGTNSSQESSQLGKDGKMMLNLLERADSDLIDVNSQDEKLILKIANKNIKHILPSDITEIDAQEFMELNLGRAFQNVQQSCMQLSTFCKELAESINSKNVTVVTASESNKLKDSKQNNTNEDIYKKKNDSNDHDQESPSSKSLKQEEDPEIIYFRSLCAKVLKMKSKVYTMDDTISNEDNKSKQAFTVVKSYTDCSPSTSTIQSANGSTHSKQYNDTFSKPSASKGCHFMYKVSNLPVISSECSNESPQIDYVGQNKKSKLNSNTILNKPVLNKVKRFAVTPSKDEDNRVFINKEFPKVQNPMTICTRKSLFGDTKKVRKRLKKVKPILTYVPSGQIHKDMVNSSRSTLKLHRKLNSNTVLNNPDLISINDMTTASEDDDCVLINQEHPKVQNAMTLRTHKSLFGDTKKARKRLKKVKPILTCVPSGQIHKDMVNSSRGTSKLHQKLNSNTVLNNPDLVSINDMTTASEDDDSVLINHEHPKVQNAMTVCTCKRSTDDSTEANKRLKVVKPIFTCNRNGLIHKSMVYFINKKENKSNKY